MLSNLIGVLVGALMLVGAVLLVLFAGIVALGLFVVLVVAMLVLRWRLRRAGRASGFTPPAPSDLIEGQFEVLDTAAPELQEKAAPNPSAPR